MQAEGIAGAGAAHLLIQRLLQFVQIHPQVVRVEVLVPARTQPWALPSSRLSAHDRQSQTPQLL